MNAATDAVEITNDSALAGAVGSELGAQSADVRDFCVRLGIEKEATEAVAIAHETLRPERIRLEPAGDPEGDGEWLVVRADVRGPVDEVLARYSACKDEWLRRARPDKTGVVRFVYNIAGTDNLAL
jgi:hypothetical protein